MNKTWLKRTLVGVAASAALLGSLAAYSQGDAPPHGGHFHGGPPAGSVAEHEAGFLAHVGKSLSLDANQTAKLQALATLLKAQHQALAGTDPHAKVTALIAGNTFDRTGAQQLVTQKVAQIQANSPALINAAGDFFDSLNATQQQQVRDFAARHHGFGGHKGPPPPGN